MYLDRFMNYLTYSNSNSNSSESSYDLRVTSFFYPSDPPLNYEFDNIDVHHLDQPRHLLVPKKLNDLNYPHRANQ